MSFFNDVIKGIVIGIGVILPGVSSGVLCMLMGIYEKILDSIITFFKDIRKNIIFLLPYILGVLIGIIVFSNMLKNLLYEYPIQTKGIFIGLIIGSIPTLIKQINMKEKFEKINIVFLIIAFIIGILITLIERYIVISETGEVSNSYLIFSGIIMSVGYVIPGVSSTIILMSLGVYSLYLQSISAMYFPVLIPLGIGLGIGSIFLVNITKYLLQNHYSKMSYSIIGFTIGSVYVLMPEISYLNESVILVISVCLGLIITKILIIK